jgi:4-diphosphocytidyl-2-C-methyl-D-erythritol kinase
VIRVDAPAKLNLYLHVVGRRADGYHLIDSLAVFAALRDTLTATAADDLTLDVDGPFAAALGGEADNLVLRAARALAEAHGTTARARLSLTKRIPVAAGLGGGSADAAATLQALSRLWKVAIPPDLGVRLGADVPICFAGQPSQMAGIGDRLTPAPALPAASLLLVNPGIAMPTRDVFAKRQGPFSAAAPLAAAPHDAIELAQSLRSRRNDLTDAAMAIAPVIGDVIAAIEATQGCLLARMSGSGATVFGLYAGDAEAERAARAIGAQHPRWFAWEGPMLQPHPMSNG